MLHNIKKFLSIVLCMAILMTVGLSSIAVGAVSPEKAAFSVESIAAVANITIAENVSGYTDYDEYGNEYFCYYVYLDDFTYTVTYNGGNTFTGSYEELYEKFGYYPDGYHDQDYENQWGIGTHTVLIEFMGKSCYAEIEIVKNPIERITAVTNVTLVEGVDGIWDVDWIDENNHTDEYYAYNVYLADFIFTVTYDGGKTFTGSADELYEKFGYYPSGNDDQSYENPWSVGTHTVTLNFMGKTCETEIQVVKNPIESITAVANTAFIEGVDGSLTSDWIDEYNHTDEYFRYYAEPVYFTYTVTYDGGKAFTGSAYELYAKFGYLPEIETDQSYENQWGAGTHTVSVNFMGKTCEAEIEIVSAEKYKKIEIKNENGLTLEITKEDGTVISAVASGFDVRAGGENSLSGFVDTNAGVINATFSWDTGTRIGSKGLRVTVGNCTSNAIDGNMFLDIYLWKELRSIAAEHYIPDFDGAVTDKNIDAVIGFAYAVSLLNVAGIEPDMIENGVPYYRFSVDDAMEVVSGLFNITIDDLTKSNYYDADSKTILVPEEDFDFGGDNFTSTLEYNKTTGGYTTTFSYISAVNSAEITVVMKWDRYGKISGVSVDDGTEPVIMGDVDGDGVVTMRDVLLLRKYVMGIIDETEINLSVADLDESGEITVKDVLLLRRAYLGI